MSKKASERAEALRDAYYAGDISREEVLRSLTALVGEYRTVPESHGVLRKYYDNSKIAEAYLMPQVYDIDE